MFYPFAESVASSACITITVFVPRHLHTFRIYDFLNRTQKFFQEHISVCSSATYTVLIL